MVDIHLGGPRFTWSDKCGSKFSKLDRFLVTVGILDYFPHIDGLVLEKKIHGHRRILLVEQKAHFGPFPFLFFHSWLDMEGFDDVFRHSWASGMESNKPWVRCKKKL